MLCAVTAGLMNAPAHRYAHGHVHHRTKPNTPFVVAPCQEHGVGIQHLVRKQREDVFDGKRAAVHKVTVEQVRVVGRRFAVHVEDVEQVVKLAVGVSTHGNDARDTRWPRFWHADAHEGRRFLKNGLEGQQNLDGVQLVEAFLVAKVLHHSFHKLQRHFVAVKSGAFVRRRHDNRADVQPFRHRDATFTGNGFLKRLLLDQAVTLRQLGSCVPVPGLHAGHRQKVFAGELQSGGGV